MENKTVTMYLWNMPLECAEVIVGSLRCMASSFVLDGEDEKAKMLLNVIEDCDKVIEKAYKEAEEHETVEI